MLQVRTCCAFCRAMLCQRSLCRHAMSVCHVCGFCQNEKKNRLFSLSGSHTILVSPRQTSWRYFDGDPLTRTSNSGRNRNSEAIYGSIACCERLERQVTASATSAIHSAATDHGDLMTLVARKRRSLLTAGEETTTKCL